MRTLLICHHDAPLDHDGLARWLASFSTLAGVVVITEAPDMVARRARREWKRSGTLGFADVLAFRLYAKAFLARRDNAFAAREQDRLAALHPAVTPPVLNVSSVNAPEVARFIREAGPDIVVARSKQLMKRDIYSLARTGSFVMHPGICPEYRNAHGCFWALACRDRSRVGMTLLKIDDGIDTGPVYGYYTYAFDERRESHNVIQTRVVTENLDAIALKLTDIVAGKARPIDGAGRASAVWGQPKMSSYVGWKARAWWQAR